MNSVLSRFRRIAKSLGFGASKFSTPETARPMAQPRLMAEVLGRNWLGRKTYGAALLYMPEAGLLYVKADGSTNVVWASSCAEYRGDSIRFKTIYPLNGPTPYVTFSGVGDTCAYHNGPRKRHTLTELPRSAFEVLVEGYGKDRVYKVILK